MLAHARFLLYVAGCAFGASAAIADATFTTTYGGGDNNFSSHLSGLGDFTVSGGGTLRLVPPPVLSTAGPIQVQVTLPTQTQVLKVNKTISSSPTGTGTISLQDLYNGQTSDIGAPPGPDGRADDGLVIDSQMAGNLSSLDLDLFGSSEAVAFGYLSLTAATEIDAWGLPFTVPLTIDVSPSLLVGGLGFAQTGSAVMSGQTEINPGFADGAHPNVPGAANLSTQYDSVISSGVLSGNSDGLVGVEFSVDFGLLGSYSQDHGEVAFGQESFAEGLALAGAGHFLQIAMAESGIDFDDLKFLFSGELDSAVAPIVIPVSLTGTVPVSQDFEFPVDFGVLGVITFDLNFNGSLTFTLESMMTFSVVDFFFESQPIAEAVNVPEAGSLVLLGMAGIAGIAASLRHRRHVS